MKMNCFHFTIVICILCQFRLLTAVYSTCSLKKNAFKGEKTNRTLQYTLGGHFIRNTLLILQTLLSEQGQFFQVRISIGVGIIPILVHIDMIASDYCCRLCNCSSTSRSFSVEFRSGDWGDH